MCSFLLLKRIVKQNDFEIHTNSIQTKLTSHHDCDGERKQIQIEK